MDGAGNLYGTTSSGGGNGRGVVFQVTPDEIGTAWNETVLYSFCSQTNCADGAGPLAGLIIDSAGNLYGTTTGGGNGDAFLTSGTAFHLTPHQTGTAWTETVLYRFCSQTSCADGAQPYAGLIMDGAGNLYGTTSRGGNSFGDGEGPQTAGVVFALNASLTARGQRGRQR
jgi:uncharacterized repeat protein (TIGR03803 family)